MDILNRTTEAEYNHLPYPHIVIDNFLSDEECNQLISDASETIKKYSRLKGESRKAMGGRTVLPCTDDNLKTLLKASDKWCKVHKLLNSKEIVDLIIKEAIDSDTDHAVKKWIRSKKLFISDLPSIRSFLSNKLIKKWKRNLNSHLSSVSSKNLLLTALLNITDDFYRTIISILENIKGIRRIF